MCDLTERVVRPTCIRVWLSSVHLGASPPDLEPMGLTDTGDAYKEVLLGTRTAASMATAFRTEPGDWPVDLTDGPRMDVSYCHARTRLGYNSGRRWRMTKADLVEQAAGAIGQRVTKRDCGLVIDAFLDAVKEALARGDGIELRGFGTFKVRHRKARTGRNPRTGEPVEVPARNVPVFQPSTLLRERVDRR